MEQGLLGAQTTQEHISAVREQGASRSASSAAPAPSQPDPVQLRAAVRRNNREANSSVCSGLAGLFWTDAGEAEEPRPTALSWGAGGWVFLYFLYGCYQAWTVITADAPAVKLTGPFVALYEALLFSSLMRNSHPSTGALVEMCGCRELSAAELGGLRRWRWFCLASAALSVMAGLSAFAVPREAADGRADATEWGGEEATPFALGWRLLVFSPWLYSFIAAFYLSKGAADAAVHALSQSDAESGRGAGQAGRDVQTMQEEVLSPLSQGWGSTVGIFVVICLLQIASVLPPIIQGSVEAIVGAAVFSLMALLLLLPWALVTSRCREIMEALNSCRTLGAGTGLGMVDPAVDARISVVVTYLKELNAGRGVGVVILGQVFSRDALLLAAAKLLGYATIALPLLAQAQRGDGFSSAW